MCEKIVLSLSLSDSVCSACLIRALHYIILYFFVDTRRRVFCDKACQLEYHKQRFGVCVWRSENHWRLLEQEQVCFVASFDARC